MFHSHRAYINATGKITAYTLTHDVKRALADAKTPSGLVSILSTQATTSVALVENDDNIKKALLSYMEKEFGAMPDKMAVRRTSSGPDKFHLMACLTGLSLTLPFAMGRLLTNLQHEVVALDYEPRAGRREFIITVMGVAAQAPAQQGAPQMR